MSRSVYIWPADIGGSTLYGDPNRVRTTEQWDGAPGQATAHVQRSLATISGEIVRRNAPDFDIMLDRLRGGINLVGLWDFEFRLQNGWDLEPALDSSGNEFWRANGRTSLYNGESDNAPTGPWRTVDATCNGGASAAATSLPVTGLLASEVIPRGAWIRIGDFRHRVLTAVTANSSGNATLTLASPLRAAVADTATVTIPGDLFVGYLVSMDVSPADVDGVRTFDATFREVYSDEVTGGFTWLGL